MHTFIDRHSAWLLMCAGIVGFIFPSVSAFFFPLLPYILFFLMLFTLLGIKQEALLSLLFSRTVWWYAILHSVGFSVIAALVCTVLNTSTAFFIAVIAITATGTLFATPAIAKTLGFDALFAMALTIATTLLMPIVLFINLTFFKYGDVHIDIYAYLQRLCLFIFAPMLLSACCYRYINHQQLSHYHRKLSRVTVILIFAFPIGLVGPLRHMFDQSLWQGLSYAVFGLLFCSLFFSVTWLYYRYKEPCNATLYAVTATNRNVLLTYTVASSSLSAEYLALMAAIQLPTYALPLLLTLTRQRQYPKTATSRK